jgi:uncharacterized protein YjbJ (UPF0337 family)
MTKAKGVKDEIAGKAKRVIGEVIGDQKLDDEGKAQERDGRKESEETDGAKPLGNLDQLT